MIMTTNLGVILSGVAGQFLCLVPAQSGLSAAESKNPSLFGLKADIL
jgi:hypothetical protein